MKQMAIAITAALLASALLATTHRVLVNTGLLFRIQDWFAAQLFRLGKPYAEAVKRNPAKAVRHFVRWLGRDQVWLGHFDGQFGKRTGTKESRLFSTPSEELSTKPRLFLTGWPVFVLSSIGQGHLHLRRAKRGVTALLHNGAVWVSQSALPQTPPESQPRMVSYRHTIRASQILLAITPACPQAKAVLGRMLDTKGSWQNEDGGWAQCDRVYTDSDLLATAYAVGLLHTALAQSNASPGVINESCTAALESSLDFLEREWHRNQWAYYKVSAEQNSVLVFCETVTALLARRPSFAEDLLAWIRGWLNPAGAVSDAYHIACQPALGQGRQHDERLRCARNDARVAYALFRAGESRSLWLPIYENALSEWDNSLNCVDVAFLLHMTWSLREA